MAKSLEGEDTTTLLTHDTAKSLLRCPQPSIFVTAEDKRMWSKRWAPACIAQWPGSVVDQLWDSLLLRTYDAMSGSQPDGLHRMLAREPRMRLDKDRARIDSLTTHANHGIWEDTPYISFTTSPDALRELAESRTTKRGIQSIVVVDPRVRIERGLPVLHYKTEMEFYKVRSPYMRNYWDGHYLCLWEVTPEEVVGIWEWADLQSRHNWFAETVLPAVEAHRKQQERYQVEGNDSLEVDEDNRDDDGANKGTQGHEAFDDTEDNDTDNEKWSGPNDSDGKVVQQNWTGQLTKMYEDLKLE